MVVERQHTPVDSEQPLKHKSFELPQLKPIAPVIKQPVATQIVLFEYAPGFPGIPPPQQHILAPLPPAPQISTVAIPLAGAIQQTSPHIFVRTLPCV